MRFLDQAEPTGQAFRWPFLRTDARRDFLVGQVAMTSHDTGYPLSRRSLGLFGLAACFDTAHPLTRFDPEASGMVSTLAEEFAGPVGSWWQDQGGKFSPTCRYFSATPNNIHPLGQNAQFFSSRERQAFTWEGDPNNSGVTLFSKHPTNPSIMRMSAIRAAPAYPSALKPWLAPCLESSNGAIWLRPRSDPYDPGDRRGHEQRYGCWQVRCTIPNTVGTLLWPAWWLYGKESAEVDIFERVGAEFTTNVRHRPSAGNLKPWGLPFDPSGEHIWSVLWTPKCFRFLCDGVEYRRVAVAPDYAYYGPLYMVLSLGVGGAWPENPPNDGTDAATPARPFMDVDYIRVWQFREFAARLAL
jgi:hypothetical protein